MTDEIRFTPLDDGSEEDCQCARCGSSATLIDCDNCGGSGAVDSSDWEGGYVEDGEDCDVCDGVGGWWQCVSDFEWCNAHPIDGRESIDRGKIEWFSIPERTA